MLISLSFPILLLLGSLAHAAPLPIKHSVSLYAKVLVPFYGISAHIDFMDRTPSEPDDSSQYFSVNDWGRGGRYPTVLG